MSYSLTPIAPFKRKAKRLIKKYPSLQNELFSLNTDLQVNPATGTAIGRNCYKIRLAIASKGGGKSGGVRIITLVLVADKKVYLLDIYDKSEQRSISDKELLALVKDALEQNTSIIPPPPALENPLSGEAL